MEREKDRLKRGDHFSSSLRTRITSISLSSSLPLSLSLALSVYVYTKLAKSESKSENTNYMWKQCSHRLFQVVFVKIVVPTKILFQPGP